MNNEHIWALIKRSLCESDLTHSSIRTKPRTDERFAPGDVQKHETIGPN